MGAILFLKGAEVSRSIKETMIKNVSVLESHGISPTVAVVRVGDKESDISYEKSIIKCCDSVGVLSKRVWLNENAGQEELEATVDELNRDKSIHGILVFMPLPAGYDDARIRKMISPEKDIDGMTGESAAAVFAGEEQGFAPCTAQAVVEILKFYKFELSGARVCIIGRSLVVGRPLSMLLLKENATVTICHSKTLNPSKIARESDILIAATGKMKSIGKDFFADGQVIIDVGIHFDSDGKMCGDVDFSSADDLTAAVTPVPGGVGSVTTAVLISHVVKSAMRGL